MALRTIKQPPADPRGIPSIPAGFDQFVQSAETSLRVGQQPAARLDHFGRGAVARLLAGQVGEGPIGMIEQDHARRVIRRGQFVKQFAVQDDAGQAGRGLSEGESEAAGDGFKVNDHRVDHGRIDETRGGRDGNGGVGLRTPGDLRNGDDIKVFVERAEPADSAAPAVESPNATCADECRIRGLRTVERVQFDSSFAGIRVGLQR